MSASFRRLHYRLFCGPDPSPGYGKASQGTHARSLPAFSLWDSVRRVAGPAAGAEWQTRTG